MKVRLNPLLIALYLSGCIAVPAFADTTSNTVQHTDQSNAVQIVKHSSQEESTVAHTPQIRHQRKKANPQTSVQQRIAFLQKKEAAHEKSGTVVTQHDLYSPFDPDAPGKALVTTGPYVGVPIQYMGSELIINSPSVNTDVQLLDLRKSIMHQLADYQIDSSDFKHTHLLFSGVVEGEVNYTDVGGGSNTSDIDVTNVSLDAFFMGPSDWTLGFIEFTYDNGLTGLTSNNSTATNNYRSYASRVFINKAFITLGDFNVSPYYATLGQYYVPFGVYSSLLVTDVVTKLLARTKERAITLGIQQQDEHNAFYTAIYGYKGETRLPNQVNNGGLNVGYRINRDSYQVDVGAGVITNLADSGGMQLGTNFASYETITHRVPAYDVHGSVSFFNHYNLLGEYVTASTRFNPNDMTYNNRGAKPTALDTQLAYSFYILGDRPSSVGIGYARTTQALALDLPTNRYSVVFNTSLWRNTLQSLELRHDVNYAASDTANGPVGAQSPVGTCVAAACVGSGQPNNAITFLFDYYF
ncbi:MAG: hypothetical protein A3F12_07855 [Gammaproteobacteria bacterium RIFCSPHIGHO2_12_FULL_38_14]|nr:MAG: hypothetical protein A3F12_07855 [Gammaproteobacteria bacterium RIFCSPHIGHO2_12_FULL_38_14]